MDIFFCHIYADCELWEHFPAKWKTQLVCILSLHFICSSHAQGNFRLSNVQKWERVRLHRGDLLLHENQRYADSLSCKRTSGWGSLFLWGWLTGVFCKAVNSSAFLLLIRNVLWYLPVYGFGYRYPLDFSSSTKTTRNTGIEMKMWYLKLQVYFTDSTASSLRYLPPATKIMWLYMTAQTPTLLSLGNSVAQNCLRILRAPVITCSWCLTLTSLEQTGDGKHLSGRP